MKDILKNRLLLLPQSEFDLRVSRIRTLMDSAGVKAVLIADNANLYYITGRVFAGFVYLPAEGQPIFFVRRPVELDGDGVVYIRKPEEITLSIGLNMPENIGLELDTLPYSSVMRLHKVFPDTEMLNASSVMRQARAVKTPHEIDMIRRSGLKHELVYSKIPKIFTPGMSDIELQVEIERISRLEGCLGQFRISGSSMELHMGNVLAGENADAPSPYDFAMGGAGNDPSLPVGADGT
ncbi:MAG: aminopeptidase P family N-terminal domain-containing protein, partial [Duncaniella sp.]|nr:aminopeptidase P family N-terminal domain-containing protein [Duncaniella sp.]